MGSAAAAAFGAAVEGQGEGNVVGQEGKAAQEETKPTKRQKARQRQRERSFVQKPELAYGLWPRATNFGAIGDFLQTLIWDAQNAV